MATLEALRQVGHLTILLIFCQPSYFSGIWGQKNASI